jgi:hypothetical protein
MKPLAAHRRLTYFEIAACWCRVVQTRSLIAAAFTLLSAGSALAQTASVPKAKVDVANAAWRRLSQREVDCVDKALRVRGSQIWQLIERGIGPGDASVASVRAGCRTEAKTPVAPTAVANSTPARAVQASRATESRAAGAPTRESVEPATAVAAATPAARPAPAKPIVEHPASAMAAADRTTIANTGAEDTAEFNIAPGKPPVERAAATRATSVNVVTAAVSGGKLAANEAVEDKASAETVVQVARIEAERVKAEADQARYEAERAIADAIASAASAKWGIGFVQGLISGPAMLAAGAIVFLLLRRRRRALAAT